MICSRIVKRVDSQILEIAKRQQGVISRSQLTALALTRAQVRWRMRRDGWKRELPGVFRMAWSEPSWMQKVWAATLWAEEDAIVSHRTAARLWGLEVGKGDAVELSAPHPLRSPASWVLTHRIRPTPKSSRRSKHGIPITSPARTLIDLAATADAEQLERAVEDAVRRGLASVAELDQALHWAPVRTRGALALKRVLGRAESSPEHHSELERRALQLFRRAGLPDPHCHFIAADGDRRLAEVDFAWPAAKLIVEAEGFQFHSGRRAWERDLARYNALVLRGWRVLRLTWHDVGEGADAFVATVARCLGSVSKPRAGKVSGVLRNSSAAAESQGNALAI